MFSTFFIHSSAFVRCLFIYIVSLRPLLLHFFLHPNWKISICVVSLKNSTPCNRIMVVDKSKLYFFCWFFQDLVKVSTIIWCGPSLSYILQDKKIENTLFRQWRGRVKQDTCQQQMFDPLVVMVASAGPPNAVPLWVPALRAGCLRGGGMVSGRYDTEEWLTPACHLTWVLSVRDSGMFTRVDTHVCTSH